MKGRRTFQIKGYYNGSFFVELPMRDRRTFQIKNLNLTQ
jgi:hypothetical protein